MKLSFSNFYLFILKTKRLKGPTALTSRSYPSHLSSLSVIFTIETQPPLQIKKFLHHYLFHITENCQLQLILLDFFAPHALLEVLSQSRLWGKDSRKNKCFLYSSNCGVLAYLTTHLKDVSLQKPTQQNLWQEKFPWLIFYKQTTSIGISKSR